MAKLLIVDDHPLYREGVIRTLSARPLYANAVGVATSEDALRMLDEDPSFDLVLVDRKLSGSDGLDLLREIGARHPDVARMLTSADASAATMTAAVKAGAQGFVPKDGSIAQTIDAIGRVLAGEVYWPKELGELGCAGVPDLTQRQRDTLRLLAEGRSNAQIAYALGISERTVKAHLKAIYEALRVDTRVQALVKARELGLLA
ncbi:MAG TPA: response regulator transcription factor [Burkholderiales bacterium]|nr:response regulator transcription factor [Burkholderiales bacterium]